jgi:hypothetical protein
MNDAAIRTPRAGRGGGHGGLPAAARRRLVQLPTFALFLVVTAAGLAGCGKKGDPVEPEDVTLTYPRDYPTSR